MATNESYLPSEYNTGIVRGDDFSEMFTFTVDGEAFDLGSATGRIQIKTNMGVTIGTWSSNNGISVANNTLVWSIDNTETATFPVASDHKYDIEITVGSSTRTYVKGIFTVVGDITSS